MNKNNLWKILFGLVVIISTILACNKQKITSTNNLDDGQILKKARISSACNILYSESADSGVLFNGISKQTSTSYGITTDSSIFFNGTKSARFELRDTDAMVQNGTRAEVIFGPTTNLNQWYGFAMYMPSAYWQYDNIDEVITQWHQGGGATPPLCLRTKKDSLYLRVMGTKWLKIGGTGAMAKDVWRQMGIHIKFSSDTSTNPNNSSTGLVEITMDGYWMLRYYGQNMYPVGSTYSNPIWKLGIYKSAWNDNGTTMTNKRVIYFDRIQMGDANCSEDDFYNF